MYMYIDIDTGIYRYIYIHGDRVGASGSDRVHEGSLDVSGQKVARGSACK